MNLTEFGETQPAVYMDLPEGLAGWYRYCLGDFGLRGVHFGILMIDACGGL